MSSGKKKEIVGGRVLADNRKARFHYEIIETLEAGIQLVGTEVKSLRYGKAAIAESYATIENNELFLINAHIPEYTRANRFNHDPRRLRRLLVHRRQMNKLAGAVQKQGMTLVPLKLYFNQRGRVKIEIALAKGKKVHDKRESEKKRDWQRQKARLLRRSQ